MDRAWLGRMRWRRRGAWLWPAFVAATLVDAAVGHVLPPAGETQTLFAAGLIALVANLLAVLFLSRPLGALLRRRRRDLPQVVARNYAGTAAVIAVALTILAIGAAHHSTVTSHQRAMRDAVVRAVAWIGDRAPAQFRRNLRFVDAFAIEPGSIYRACVRSDDGARTYCVIVNTHLPFARSVRFDGYEPNAVFGNGVG